MSRFANVLAAGFAVTAALSLARAQNRLYGDAVVAVVEKEIITVYDLQEAVRHDEMELRALYQGEELRDKLMELRREVADRLVERELVYAEFKALGAKVPPAVLQDRLDRIIATRAGGDRKRFEDALAAEGMTYREYEQRIAKGVAVDILLNERVLRHIDIGPRDIERFYAERRADLAQKPGYHLQTIVLRKEGSRHGETLAPVIAKIQRQLAEGTAFDDLARQYSESPRAESGGDEGWIGDPSGKLKEALEGLSVGQVTPAPVDLGSSLYLVRLKDRRGGDVPPLTDELRRQIETRLYEEERNARLKAFIDQLRTKYFVKTVDDFTAAEAPKR